MEKPNYYAIIPAEVRYCKDLPDGAKLLYGEITALSSSDRNCTARNRYFAELYGVEIRTIQKWISLLLQHGFIQSASAVATSRGQRELSIATAPRQKYDIESYNEILTRCGISGELRRTFFEFIKHCQLNGRIITNDKLYSIIVRLDLRFGKDDNAKIDCLTTARNQGYFDVKTE